MSTLDMILQEGEEIGIKKGEEIGIKMTQLKNLLNILQKLPDWSTKETALFTGLNFALVKKIKTAFQAKDKQRIYDLSLSKFFKDTALREEDMVEIERLVDNALPDA